MELTFVEVRDRRGVVTDRVRLDSTDAFVGRSLDNDVVLRDDYADAAHLRIRVLADAPTVLIQDLGTTNGTVVGGRLIRGESAEVGYGDPIEVGEVTLTFRSQSAAVPRAKVLARPSPRAFPYERIPTWSAFGLLVAYATGTILWASYETAEAWTAIGMAVGIGLLMLLWAGAFAAGTRVRRGAWHFREHLGVVSVLGLVMMSIGSVLGALAFALSDPVADVVIGWGLLGIGFWGLLLFAHIDVASRRSRTFKAGLAAGLVCGLGLALYAGLQLETIPSQRIQNSLSSIYPVSASLTRSGALDDFLERAAAMEGRHEELAEIGDASSGAQAPGGS